MEGSIGFSCYVNDGRMRTIKIWMLEDYEREVWSFKYNIELPVEYFSLFEYRPYLVLSNKGDVLIYYPSIGHICSTAITLANC
jgi:hypothetical protein